MIKKGDIIAPEEDGKLNHFTKDKMYKVRYAEQGNYGYQFHVTDDDGDVSVCRYPGICSQLKNSGQWRIVRR